MKTETPSLADVVQSLSALQAEISRLGERLAVLEAGQASRSSTSAPAEPASEALSEETVLIIGAAIAAFLGKKAQIRQIQLLGSAAWAQQGRVTIQASHALSTARSQP